MLLAADVGGTKTLLGLFEEAPERPASIETGEFVTLEYDSLVPMIREFLKAEGVEPKAIAAATFGVAGAVTDQVARLTNVPWLVDAAAIGQAANLRRVHLLNDLEAMAHSVAVLEPGELAVIQQGLAQSGGNAAVIAAGTGLGEAILLNVDGRFHPGATEAGHADCGARTPREVELLSALIRVYGRGSNEHVISGPGLVNVYQFTHDAFGSRTWLSPAAYVPARTCAGVGTIADPADLPAAITKSAFEKRCPMCVESLDLFVAAYGAEAGNLALRTVATAGVYVGGGIAPKILPAIQSGLFLDAFRAKEPLADFVATVPVAVILNPEAGLLGAAVHANSIA
ncbi:MAG TPA: glucokinase [Vicinamibacterales bacterium]|nr:glucokinase [Vicinamibacterales bacterium]